MSDRTLGTLMFVLCLAGAVLYVGWLFWPASTDNVLFYFSGMRWAVILPVLVAVLGVVFVGMWIGYTMATTPPPMTIEEELKEQIEQEASESGTA